MVINISDEKKSIELNQSNIKEKNDEWINKWVIKILMVLYIIKIWNPSKKLSL